VVLQTGQLEVWAAVGLDAMVLVASSFEEKRRRKKDDKK
jgi:hypothetical protein